MAKVSRSELIQDYNRVAEELDKKPTLGEYNEHGEYSSTPIYRRFESFEELKEQAGFETGPPKISDEKLLADLQRVADEIGRSPPVMVYDERGKHNSKTFKRRWGSWNKVLQEAGLEPTGHSEHWKDSEAIGAKKEYGDIEVECDYCGGPTTCSPYHFEQVDRVHCGPECKAKAMSEQTGERARAWNGGKVEIQCEICGDTKKVKPAEVDGAKFCSRGCKGQWVSENFNGEDHPRWKGGYNRYYGPNWYRQRDKALERDGYECQACGMTQAEHQDKYDCNPVVHHIVRFGDYDDYKEANRLENLISLCKQCHGFVESGRIDISD